MSPPEFVSTEPCEVHLIDTSAPSRGPVLCDASILAAIEAIRETTSRKQAIDALEAMLSGSLALRLVGERLSKPIGYTSPGQLRRLRDGEDDSLSVEAESIIGCDVPVYAHPLAATGAAIAAREQDAPKTLEDALYKISRLHDALAIATNTIEYRGRRVKELKAALASREESPAFAAREQEARHLRKGEPLPPPGERVPQCEKCGGCREWGGNGLWHHAGCPTKQGAAWLQTASREDHAAIAAREQIVVTRRPGEA